MSEENVAVSASEMVSESTPRAERIASGVVWPVLTFVAIAVAPIAMRWIVTDPTADENVKAASLVKLAGLIVAGFALAALLLDWKRGLTQTILNIIVPVRKPGAWIALVIGVVLFSVGHGLYYLDHKHKNDQTIADLQFLDTVAQTYRANRGKYPDALHDLNDYIDGSERELRDPWGRLYDYDRKGPRNGGKRLDIWTVSPSGEQIGNWMLKSR